MTQISVYQNVGNINANFIIKQFDRHCLDINTDRMVEKCKKICFLMVLLRRVNMVVLSYGHHVSNRSIAAVHIKLFTENDRQSWTHRTCRLFNSTVKQKIKKSSLTIFTPEITATNIYFHV